MRRSISAPIAAMLTLAPLSPATTPAHAQLRRNPPATSSPPPASPTRSPHHLLRNGLDYLDKYGDPHRALVYLEQARQRQAELSPDQRKQLADAWLRAERILAGLEQPTNPIARYTPNPARPPLPSLPPDSPQLAHSPRATTDPNLQVATSNLNLPTPPPSTPTVPPPPLMLEPDEPTPNLTPTPPSLPNSPNQQPLTATPLTLESFDALDPPPTVSPATTTPDLPQPDSTPAVLHPTDAPAPTPDIPQAPSPQPDEPTPDATQPHTPSTPAEPPLAATPLTLDALDPQPEAPAPPDNTLTESPAPPDNPQPESVPPPPDTGILLIPPPPRHLSRSSTLPELPTPSDDSLPPLPLDPAQVAPSPAELPAPPPELPRPTAPEPTSPSLDLPELPIPADPAVQQPQPTAATTDLPTLPHSSAAPTPRGDDLPPIQIQRPEVLREVEDIARRLNEENRQNPVVYPPPTTDDTQPDSLRLGSDRNTALIPRAPSPTEARPIRPIPVPDAFVPLDQRRFAPYRKYFAAGANCNMPLYFQDAALERYGQSVEQALGPHWGRFFSYPLDDPRQSTQRNQLLQPFYSTGLFALQIAALPIHMLFDPPWEAQYDLGFHRPGDPTPPDLIYWPKLGIGPPGRGRKY